MGFYASRDEPRIDQYRPGRGHSLRAKFKAKYALDENFFRHLLEYLRCQSSALHLLLSATALSVPLPINTRDTKRSMYDESNA